MSKFCKGEFVKLRDEHHVVRDGITSIISKWQIALVVTPATPKTYNRNRVLIGDAMMSFDDSFLLHLE